MELSLLEFHKQVRQLMVDNGLKVDDTVISSAKMFSGGSFEDNTVEIRTTIFSGANILDAFQAKNFEQVLHKVKNFFENRKLESPIPDVLVDVDTTLSPESVVDDVELM